MQSDNYILIQGWMCSELNLKGNALLIFALIHGFSQDGQSRFYGSRNYIADTLNISLPTVDKAIEELRDKNLITRYVITDENGVHYEYETCKETLQGVVKKLYGGSKETLHNNTSKKTNNKKVVSKDTTTEFSFGKKSTPKKENLYTKCLNMIDAKTTDATCRLLLRDWLSMLLEKYRGRGKVLYANVFKGKLNMLDKFDEKDWADIIRYNIQRGYEGFYPINDFSSKPTDIRKGKAWEEGLSCETYTEEEKREIERLTAEREARGEQVWY